MICIENYVGKYLVKWGKVAVILKISFARIPFSQKKSVCAYFYFS